MLSLNKKAPAYSFAGKHMKDQVLEFQKTIPGPGHYSPVTKNEIGLTKIGVIINKADNLRIAKDLALILEQRKKVPGVGKYEINKSTMDNVPSTRIGKSPRSMKTNNMFPGVGKYDLALRTISRKSAVFGNQPRQMFLGNLE